MHLPRNDLKSLWLTFFFWTASLAFIFDGQELELDGILYSPSQYNETGDYYLYSNIRYAAPPVGDLRWAKPQPPRASDPSVDPNANVTCTQVTPNWWNITGFPSGFTGGVEDCLFLDVYVPRNQTYYGKTPVMLWIHGGGFITGSKTASGDPSGLLWAADEPIIYVTINYRLGGLGFLAGQEIASSGIANAGLHDQRAAFHWIRDHIAAFGGNPADITVFGESAGAASIMYHLTGYGGKDCPPFRRAILQSNAFCPWRGHANNEARFLAFANAAGCSDLQCLRNTSTETVIDANIQLLINATEIYQPQVDGDLVPDFPGWLLRTGKFCNDVEIMIGNNDDEGGWMLNNPAVHDVAYSNDASEVSLKEGFTLGLDTPLTTGTFERLLELYPAPSSNTSYRDMVGLQELFQSEVNFLSSTFAIVSAWNKHAFVYKFSVGYTIHAMDVPYTYYDGSAAEVKNATAAIALQKYLTRFAISGDPNQKPVENDTLPLFLRMDTGMTKPVFKIGDSSYEYVNDDYFMNERTEFLASGLWI